jgi:hypothetical protein
MAPLVAIALGRREQIRTEPAVSGYDPIEPV